MQTALTTKTILIALGAVLVIGGGAAVAMNKDSSSVMMQDTPVKTEVTTDATAQVSSGMSMKDLLASVASTKCTVSTSNDKINSSGVVYVSGGKMRSDFTSVTKEGPLAGKSMLAHMIVDTDMSYMWGEGEMKVGIKIARKDILDVTPENGETPANQAAMDMNEKSDFKCEKWTLDAAEFVPPTSITFNDMSAMMQNIPKAPVKATGAANVDIQTTTAPIPTGMTPQQKQQMCGACESAGAGKSQCLQQLGCK